MSDKPTALRLADDLDELVKAAMLDKSGNTARTAAELRRLHAENDALKSELAEQARLNGMGSEREARLLALNAELVEALKHAAECVRTNYLPDKCGRDWDDVIAKASR